jgi:hypothetical protein
MQVLSVLTCQQQQLQAAQAAAPNRQYMPRNGRAPLAAMAVGQPRRQGGSVLAAVAGTAQHAWATLQAPVAVMAAPAVQAGQQETMA